ncbi:MAG: cyclic-di-AMP receptor [Anaerolineales bacterium]
MLDRLAITVVDGSQSRALLEVFGREGFRATTINAVGGFLHDSLVTLLVGLPQERLERFFALLREYCPRRTRYVPMGIELSMAPGYPMMIEASVGGASVFVLPVEEFRQL